MHSINRLNTILIQDRVLAFTSNQLLNNIQLQNEVEVLWISLPETVGTVQHSDCATGHRHCSHDAI